MTQFTLTYEELLQALTAYETEAIELYPHRKKIIQLTILSMQDFMKSSHTLPFRDDQRQSSLPGLLQAPMSVVNGALHTDTVLDAFDKVSPPSTPSLFSYEATYFLNNKANYTESFKAESLVAAESIANEKCNVLTGEWSSVRCLDKPKRSMPVIQNKLDL